ncbi:hypothetical protein YYC_05576 [Plasmodium yoelii 17X]|uniref:Uncharacterized protein n=3 Tax=Plasmodium yoelii TaxID=5861 RepID=Q7RQ48_PLAYO|nr:hypothetical protein [Plasmodium yoelii yoelii]ETB56431.1 hypothetical protein YYC_05576 [Plasmodium yoelii 17X]
MVQCTAQLNNVSTSFETIKNKFIGQTKHIHNLYNTTLPNIKNAFEEFSSFLKDTIDHISSHSKKVDVSNYSGDNKSVSDDTGDGTSSSNGSTTYKKHTPQTSSETSHNHYHQVIWNKLAH